MSHISHVLAPSLELIEATRKTGFEEETTYIPNGVDTKRFAPDGPNLRANLNIGTNEFVVLVARRLVPKMEFWILLGLQAFLKIETLKS